MNLLDELLVKVVDFVRGTPARAPRPPDHAPAVAVLAKVESEAPPLPASRIPVITREPTPLDPDLVAIDPDWAQRIADNRWQRERAAKLGIAFYVWSTGNDGAVCAECFVLDGQVFRIGETPSHGFHPGERIGCRCTFTSLFDGRAVERARAASARRQRALRRNPDSRPRGPSCTEPPEGGYRRS
jgi:hypothetical protein